MTREARQHFGVRYDIVSKLLIMVLYRTKASENIENQQTRASIAGKVNVQDLCVSKYVEQQLAQANAQLLLNFAKVNVDYTPQDDKGAAGTAIPFGWDKGSREYRRDNENANRSYDEWP
jgi:type VI protein secretion system component Hcp